MWMDYEKYRLTGKEIFIVILEAIAISILVSILFFDSLWGMIICPIAIVALWKRKVLAVIEERRKILAGEFQTVLKNVSGSMLAGFSLENAFVQAQKELKQLYGENSIMYMELQSINNRVSMNTPIEGLLENLAERTRVEDIYNFADILSFAKRTGGNFVEIIDGTVNKMWAKYETSREIEVAISAKRLEQKVMNVIPIVLLAYMKITSAEYMSVLYGNIVGIVFMCFCLIGYVGAIYLAEQILAIKV